jgi:hypothetical protein
MLNLSIHRAPGPSRTMSTSDRTSVLRQIADIEEQLARLREQQEDAEATLRSLRTQLELDETTFRSNEDNSEQAHPPTPGNLTPEEKISLFLRLFRGRDDVFPRLWQNQKTGKKGYAPACANEWVRGVCEKPRVNVVSAPTSPSCR